MVILSLFPFGRTDPGCTLGATPRKCLGFLTPLQALLGELGRDVQIRFA
jgi:hypothetical protein